MQLSLYKKGKLNNKIDGSHLKSIFSLEQWNTKKLFSCFSELLLVFISDDNRLINKTYFRKANVK